MSARASGVLAVVLLLLPLVAAGSAALWAQHLYGRDLEPWRRDGVRRLIEELAAQPEAGATLQERWRRELVPPPGGVPFVIGATCGVLHGTGAEPGDEPWLAAAAYPVGLPPLALASAETQLAIELGTPPLQLEVDESTRAFARLLEHLDPGELRRAPLPAATKGFLLRRHRERTGGDQGEADLVLPHLAALEELLASGALPPDLAGVLRPPGLDVYGTGDGAPLHVFPAGTAAPLLPRYELALPDSDDVLLVWGDELPGGDTLSAADVLQPLAGTWRAMAVHGSRWWLSPRFRGWGIAIATAVPAFWLLSAVVLLELRRERRRHEARVRFLNDLAHDLRTPLATLRLHADLLAAGRGRREDGERYVRIVAREAARLGGMLSGLLDPARLEHAPRRAAPAEVSLAEAAAAAREGFAAVHPERAGDLAVHGDPSAWVLADPAALARILANLLDNAGTHTPRGCAVRLSWEVTEGRARLLVDDDGEGVAPAERDAVFERRRRGRGATVPGSGLGLALARELAREQGGDVELMPSPRGACFVVTLRGGVSRT